MPKKSVKSTSPAQSQPSLIVPNTTFQITIDKKTATSAYQQALKKKAKNLKTAGFRKGKVPTHIAESQLDAQEVIEEALQQVVPALYEAELKSRNIQPLTYPEFKPVSLEKDQEWTIEVHVAEKPQIKLGNYQTLIKTGQKEAEAHDKEIAKQQPKTPERTERAEQHQHDHTLEHIYSNLIQGIQPQIPELLVKNQVRQELENLVYRVENMGMKLDDFLKQRQMSFEQLSAQLTQQALGRLQISFILDEIAKDQKITVEKVELDAIMEKTEDEQLKKRQQSDPRYQEMLRETLVRQKLAEFLLKK